MTIHIADATLEERFSKKLSNRVTTRKLVSFWDGDLEIPQGTIDLTAGMPTARLFPINAIDLHIADGPQFGEETLSVASMSLTTPPEMPIARSFQYSETAGLPPLLEFTRNIIRTVNKPAYDNWDVLLGNGSSDSMFKLYETICDENTTVLLEEFTFTPVISNIQATGANCVPLKMQLSKDPAKQGLDVEYMADLLDNWSTGPYQGLSKPTVLYTIATGQNPTGMTLSMDKRRQIYAIAQKHDLVIVEDDPYGYLRFPKYDQADPMRNPYVDDKTLTMQTYIDEYLVRSFMTIDTDARVVRLETFSKVFAPGVRVSFVAANKFLIQKMLDYTEVSTRAPSGVSQAVVYTAVKQMAEPFLEETDHDFSKASMRGWFRWVMKVAGQYTHRRNVMFKALQETEAFQKGYFSILEPSAGMFVNIRIQHAGQKQCEGKELSQVMDELNTKLIQNRVRVVLGYKMAVDKAFSSRNCDFVRTTIAFASDDEQLAEASRRIGGGIAQYLEAEE